MVKIPIVEMENIKNEFYNLTSFLGGFRVKAGFYLGGGRFFYHPPPKVCFLFSRALVS